MADSMFICRFLTVLCTASVYILNIVLFRANTALSVRYETSVRPVIINKSILHHINNTQTAS